MLPFRVKLSFNTALLVCVDVEADLRLGIVEAFHLSQKLEEIGQTCGLQILFITEVDSLVPMFTIFILSMFHFAMFIFEVVHVNGWSFHFNFLFHED